MESKIIPGNTDILSQEMLKCIACVTMLIDHIGAIFYPQLRILRVIGRIAFPIYCFLLTEGFHYTRNRKRYFRRLAIGALLSELPFDYALRHGRDLMHQNVMLTLLLGFAALWLMDMVDNPYWKGIVTIPFVYMAELLHTDYGGWGVAMIVLLGAAWDLSGGRWIQYGVIALLCAVKKSAAVHIFGLSLYSEVFGMLAILFLMLYGGRKSSSSKSWQMAFYSFYPLHLSVLFLIYQFTHFYWLIASR